MSVCSLSQEVDLAKADSVIVPHWRIAWARERRAIEDTLASLWNGILKPDILLEGQRKVF